MTKLEFLSLLIPSISSFILVVLAWLNSSQRLTRLETAMDGMARDLREFYRILGKVEGRVEEISHR